MPSRADIKTERQLALVLLLSSTRCPLTRVEVRRAIGEYQGGSDEAFERMFERDKAELRDLGIPIATTDTADGDDAYVIHREEAALPAVELDDDERLALAVASRAWGGAGWSASAINALGKLGAAGAFEFPELKSVQATANGDGHLLDDVCAAMDDRQAIRFAYRKLGEAVGSSRVIDPWALVSMRGHWYVVGRDHIRDAQRVFRLSRIEGTISRAGSRGAFVIPEWFDASSAVCTEFPEERIDAVIRVASGAGHELRAVGEVTVGRAGWDTLRVFGLPMDWLIRAVLRAGSNAVADEPASLRAAVAGRLERVAAAQVAECDVAASALSALSQAALGGQKPDVPASADRLARLLAVIPWLRTRPGVALSEAAEHFAIPEGELRHDLALAVCTEFGPEHSTIDIDIWGSGVTVRDARSVAMPLRLSRAEVVSLLLGIRSLVGVAPPEARNVITGLEEKLRTLATQATGPEAHVAVVEPYEPKSAAEAAVVRGHHDGLAMRLTYWSAARDALTSRIVDPIGIEVSQGVAVLDAWCRDSRAVRSFRLDRVRECDLLEEPGNAPQVGVSGRKLEGPSAIFLLDVEAAWLPEVVPSRGAVTLDDGRVLLLLPVASEAWAVRTVMGLGGLAQVLEPDDLALAVVREATTAAAAYGSEPSSDG